MKHLYELGKERIETETKKTERRKKQAKSDVRTNTSLFFSKGK